jgi:hypothetical protein
MFIHGKPLQLSLMFVGKAWSLPLSGAPEGQPLRLIQKTHYDIGPWAQCYASFTAIIHDCL